jgi:hypothetical protein
VAYTTETTKLVGYIEGSEDQLLQDARTHQYNANASLLRATYKCQKNAKEKWENKRMHGQFPRSLHDMLVNRKQTYQCLKCGDIKVET